MSVKKKEITLQVAQKLLNHLPEPLNGELKILLDRAEKGQDTTIDVIDLLSAHDNIRLWMQEQISIQSDLKGDGTRGFSSLAGAPTSVPASQKWVCPKSECPRSLPVIREDEDPPTCEVHGVVMVRVSKKKG
ncbi:MAG: hypothetical protein HY863_18495 [Chloroflexi bacterium]|nr:hypothetical protein [Chloroflexota bacterium]